MFHVGVAGLLAIIVMTLQTIPPTISTGNVLKWIFPIIPTFAVTYGIVQIAFRQILSFIFEEDQLSPMSLDLAGAEVIYLIGSIFFWGGLHWAIEMGYFKRKSRRTVVNRDSFIKIDIDVEAENESCANLDPSEAQVLVKSLIKDYEV